MGEIIVKTEDLTKEYRRALGRRTVVALDGLNLEIGRGEIFGLLGPNGSGKTTALKLLLGLIFPTAGKATVFGRPARYHRQKAQIGYFPEAPYFYEFLTPVEIVDFYGRLFGIKRKIRKERVDRLLGLVGLEHARLLHLRDFSKGMLQRIGLACALINDPQLLFLDEPTIGLDPIGAREIKNLFLELKKEGKTMILSSHLLADVELVCDRVGILYQGRLIEAGKLNDLLALKDKTTITAGRLADKTRDEILAIIRREGGEVVQVDHPKESLEEFFVRSVKGRTPRY